jgi:hypothetical protein
LYEFKCGENGVVVVVLILDVVIPMCEQFAHVFDVVVHPTSTKKRFIVHGFHSRKSIIEFDDRF